MLPVPVVVPDYIAASGIGIAFVLLVADKLTAW